MPGIYGDLNDPARKREDDGWLEACCADPVVCKAAHGVQLHHLAAFICPRLDAGGNRWQGVSVVDLNNDGFLDLMPCSTRCRVYLNRGTGNSYIAFRLVGTISNEYGIGATVLLAWRAEPAGAVRLQLRELNAVSSGGASRFGSIDHRLVFGLGAAGVPVRVEVHRLRRGPPECSSPAWEAFPCLHQ